MIGRPLPNLAEVLTGSLFRLLIFSFFLGFATAIAEPSLMAVDGFGLIAFASLFSIISVLGYAQHARWRSRRRMKKVPEEERHAVEIDIGMWGAG